MDLSVFATPEAWISLVTLMFLEIVLGVDNLVFIVLTTDRLPPEKQHIGRRLGLLGALVSRCIFLCFASFLVHMTDKLFTIPGLYLNGAEFGLSVRDLVLLLGGLYLIYKGIAELRDVLNLTEEKEGQGDAEKPRKTIGLVGAVATTMVMDVVFSIDSVITAVGLANHLIVMIIAVMLAVILMMVFIDTISDFINAHTEMKILALVFITVIGVLLASRRPGHQLGHRGVRHACRKADGVLRHGVRGSARGYPDALQQELPGMDGAEEPGNDACPWLRPAEHRHPAACQRPA